MYLLKVNYVLFVAICTLFALQTFAYPYKSAQFMKIKVKPKPIQVEIDNPEDVKEMIVKDVTNQKRVLIVAKNPAKFDTSYIERYELDGKSNEDAIRHYYENANKQRTGYWQSSVLPASVN